MSAVLFPQSLSKSKALYLLFALAVVWNGSLFAQISPVFDAKVVNHFGGWVDCITPRGQYGFIKQGDHFKTMDLTAPTFTILGSCPLSTFDITMPKAYINGNVCWMQARWSPRITAVDISDPLHPRELATMSLGTKDFQSLAFYGHYMYAAQLDEGVRLIDVSDPAHPHCGRNSCHRCFRDSGAG